MLFKKDTGSSDLQKLTGYFDGNNNFTTIEQEVLFATREVASLVGDDVVREAETLFVKGTEDGLVAAVRLPVAILAVARYSMQTLVHHGDSRKVRSDDNEKLPWEWMIDRDDAAQREKYYRAMDALYTYLDESDNASWKASEPYRRRKMAIVSSLREFEAVYPIDHSYYVFWMLLSLVVEMQPRLRRRIGDEKWAAITDEPVADGDLPLLALCQRYAILSALITAVRRWSLAIFPIEIARRFSPSYQGNRRNQVATLEEMDRFVGNIEAQLAGIDDEIAEELAGTNPHGSGALMPKNHPRNKFFTAQ